MIPQTNATEQIIDITFKVDFHLKTDLKSLFRKNDRKFYGEFPVSRK